jgi:replicative DNA helicase
MRSLYGSSAVENTADAVLFVHRPSVILADIKPTHGAKHEGEHEADMMFWEGKAEFVLGKHRSRKGRGIRTVKFDEFRCWFY